MHGTAVGVLVIVSVCFVFGVVVGVGASPEVWPADVGTSHFGALLPGGHIDYQGAWGRPHPGPFIWGETEPTPGVYRWGRADKIVRDLQHRRIAIVATVWPFADWDQRSCHLDQPVAWGSFPELGDRLYLPCDMDAYLSWLSAMVERYDGDGIDDMPGLQYPIRHWELLNEPEMQGPDLCFFQEEPTAYVQLLEQSYAAVKHADEHALVVLGGQSGMHPEAVDYWRPILKRVEGAFDIANIHSIGASDQQQDIAYWTPEYAAFLAKEIPEHSYPIWVTEVEPGFKRRGMAPFTEDELAQITLKSTAAAFAHGATLVLHVGSDPRVFPGGSKSETTFNLMARVVGDFVATSWVGDGIVCFQMSDDRVVYALWGNAQLPNTVQGNVAVFSYDGARTELTASDVVAHVPVLAVVEDGT